MADGAHEVVFDPDLVLFCFRRGRTRLSTFLSITRRGEATIADVARDTGHEAKRIHAAIHGDERAFRVDRSLVGLGLVTGKPTARGRAYRATVNGRRAEGLAMSVLEERMERGGPRSIVIEWTR